MVRSRYSPQSLLEEVNNANTRKKRFISHHKIIEYFHLVNSKTLPVPIGKYFNPLEKFVNEYKEEVVRYGRKVRKEVKTCISDVAQAFKISPEEYTSFPDIEFFTDDLLKDTPDANAVYLPKWEGNKHGAIILRDRALGKYHVYAHEGGHFLRHLFHPIRADSSDLIANEFFGYAGEEVYGPARQTFNEATLFSTVVAETFHGLKHLDSIIPEKQRMDIASAKGLAVIASRSEFKSGIYVDDLVRRPTEQVERELRWQSRRLTELTAKYYGGSTR